MWAKRHITLDKIVNGLGEDTGNLQWILKSLYCRSSMPTTYRAALSGNIRPPGFYSYIRREGADFVTNTTPFLHMYAISIERARPKSLSKLLYYLVLGCLLRSMVGCMHESGVYVMHMKSALYPVSNRPHSPSGLQGSWEPTSHLSRAKMTVLSMDS